MPAVTLCSPSQKLGFKGSRYERTRCALGEPCQQRKYKAACMFLAFAFWHRSPAPESCRAGAPGAGEEARSLPGAPSIPTLQRHRVHHPAPRDFSKKRAKPHSLLRVSLQKQPSQHEGSQF